MEKNNKFKFSKCLFILLAVYITLLLVIVSIANRFVCTGSLIQPGGIFIFPFTFLICNLIGEVYGYSTGRIFIWVGIFCEFIFAIITTIVVHLPAPYFESTTVAYNVVFDPTIRFVFAGLSGLLCGEFISVFLLVKWKIKLNGKLFCLRNLGAIAIGQLLLSIIVDIIAFYGKIPFSALLIAIGSGFTWKIIITIIFIYPVWILAQYIKLIENIDYYDIGTNFNPFKI